MTLCMIDALYVHNNQWWRLYCKQMSRKWKLRCFFVFFSTGLNVIMRVLTPGGFTLSPSLLYSFFSQKWVRDPHLYQEFDIFFYFFLFINSQGIHGTPNSAFIRHRHCCLTRNGEGIFMNLHKHVLCQVSVLCMLSKHPCVIIFPNTGAIRCVSTEGNTGSSALSKRYNRDSFVGGRYQHATFISIKGIWQ